MKIGVIGATGFVGSHIVKEALSRNHDVVAFARDNTKLSDNGHLTKVSLDANDVEALAEALESNNVDAVVSAFNPGWTNPNIYDDFIAGAKHIESAVEKSGIKHFIVIGGAGSLYIDGKQLVDSLGFPEEIKPGATAARDYLNILKANTVLDWTFFSPAIEMHPGIKIGRTGKYRTGTNSPVFDTDNKSVLSVEDLAVAIIDEVENPKFLKQRFTAAY
ncbi:MAG: NAD(P)H-binding protein [Chitinophagaceae bacterium]